MQSASLQKESDSYYKLYGVLNFESVTDIYQQALPLIENANKSLILDLSQVTQSNSAGLALLTSLLRYAAQKNKKLTFLHLPEKLQSTAKISNLDPLIT